MTDCTASLPTHTVTDEVVGRLTYYYEATDPSDQQWLIDGAIPDGGVVKREGSRLLRVETHEVGCSSSDPAHTWDHWSEEANVSGWTDATPGAIPHEDPEPDADVCPHCKGEQLVGSFDTPATDPRRACPVCKGSGRIEIEVSDEEVEAAMRSLRDRGALVSEHEAVRAAIAAAKRTANKEQE